MKTAVTFGKLYLGNKMTGVPFFNAPWFDETAALLRLVPGVEEVFNPAEEDRKLGLDPYACPTGAPEEAAVFSMGTRKALTADLNWISEYSDGLVVGPEWNQSSGTITEIAFHQALGLPVWEWQIFRRCLWNHLEFRPQNYAELLDPQWQFPSLKNYLL